MLGTVSEHDPDRAMKERAIAARRDAQARVRARIRERMDETGISMLRLAKRAGVSPRTIQRFLAEPERDAYLGTIAAVAAVLLVDIRDLLEPLERGEG